jgi:hypothetical protein
VLLAGAILSALPSAAFADTALVEFGSPMRYLANSSDPGIALAWTLAGFDDSGWPQGTYGVGYETSPPGAIYLLSTTVPARTYSVYTRARFTISDPARVANLLLGADWDDGFVAWINGVEVHRSPQMPAGNPAWNTNAASHESSNGASPLYGALMDITARARPVLRAGENVLAIGVWNNNALFSSDLVLVPRLSALTSGTVSRGPYLQMGTPTSVVVRWRTPAPSDSRVLYGPDPSDLSFSRYDPAPVTEHEIRIDRLDPDTRYYYAVGTGADILAGGDSRFYFRTAPPVGAVRPTRIWVLGDSGTANLNARAVRDAYRSLTGEAHTDLWLMLGDNAYPSGTDAEYQAALFDFYPELLRRTPLWPTLGNHDGISADSSTQSGPYYSIFTLPRQAEAGGVPSGTEAYYSFDFANIHFICLESFETDRSPDGAMLTWLEEDLMETSQDWVIAFWHHPPYSKGSHDSDTEIELVQMRQNALPILERGGVDLVLTGHSHSYERSYLLDGHYGSSATLTPGMILDRGDGRVTGDGAYLKPALGPEPKAGAVYVVAGSGGSTGGGALNHPVNFVSLNVLGSVVLEVDGPRLEARFLDGAGAWRDSFTIYKGPGLPPVADFSAQPTAGTAPLRVQFSDRSANTPTAWAWDLDGNGTTDSGERDPARTYSTPGLYDVRLIAYNPLGSDAAIKPDLICVLSTDGASDADGDGRADGSDNCPCLTNPDGEDLDGDGAGDLCDPDDDEDGAPDDADCAPRSPGLFAPTTPVGPTLRFVGGPDRLEWERPPGGHTSNLYRGMIVPARPWAYDFGCLAIELPGTSHDEAAAPQPGSAFYYLVAARNGCGDSAAGRDSPGGDVFPQEPCGTLGRDTDGDGVPDLQDNCPLAPNPSQADADSDMSGDACDPPPPEPLDS